MGCGGYHDHAGGSWLFCICIGPARMDEVEYIVDEYIEDIML